MTLFPDGRYYIGQHKIISYTTLDPTYWGSGVIVKDYLDSKGTIGLKREILQFGYSFDEMNLLEQKYITEDVLKDPLNTNLDNGGKHKFTRTHNVKLKIGNTISKKRKENPNNWPIRKGKSNNKSVNWKLISPDGEEFIICGGLKSFCDSVGISANTIKKAVKENWIPRRGKCAGWRAFNLDVNIGTTRNTLNYGATHSGLNNPWFKNKKENE